MARDPEFDAELEGTIERAMTAQERGWEAAARAELAVEESRRDRDPDVADRS